MGRMNVRHLIYVHQVNILPAICDKDKVVVIHDVAVVFRVAVAVVAFGLEHKQRCGKRVDFIN